MAGRGAGKSEVGAIDVILRGRSDFGQGGLFFIGAPTVQSLHDYTIRSFKKAMHEICGWDPDRYKGGAYPEYRAGFADFAFRSAHDPERFRGPNLRGGWLDEASQYHRDAWNNFIACVRDGDKLGDVTATFTPKGLTHWSYEVFGREGPETFLVHATSRDNPFIDPKFYTDLLAMHGEHSRTALQELEGRFLDAEGAEWPGTYFADHVWFDEWPPPEQRLVRVTSCDPSKGVGAKVGDYSAIVDACLAKDGHIYADADLDATRPAEAITDALIEHSLAFNSEVVAIETNMFQYLLAASFRKKAAERNMVAATAEINNQVNKLIRIRRLGPHLENKRFRIKNSRGGRLLVAQLRDFPVADHDDGPDALEMALRVIIDLANGRARKPNTPRVRA